MFKYLFYIVLVVVIYRWLKPPTVIVEHRYPKQSRKNRRDNESDYIDYEEIK